MCIYVCYYNYICLLLQPAANNSLSMIYTIYNHHPRWTRLKSISLKKKTFLTRNFSSLRIEFSLHILYNFTRHTQQIQLSPSQQPKTKTHATQINGMGVGTTRTAWPLPTRCRPWSRERRRRHWQSREVGRRASPD